METLLTGTRMLSFFVKRNLEIFCSEISSSFLWLFTKQNKNLAAFRLAKLNSKYHVPNFSKFQDSRLNDIVFLSLQGKNLKFLSETFCSNDVFQRKLQNWHNFQQSQIRKYPFLSLPANFCFEMERNRGLPYLLSLGPGYRCWVLSTLQISFSIEESHSSELL